MPTVETGFKIHIAELGDAQSAYLNGYLRVYNAAYAALLSEHLISAVAANGDGTLTLTIDAAVVEAGISAQDAALARIYKSDGTTMLHGAFTVGTVAAGTADVQFDTVAGWNAGDIVTPGDGTPSFAGLTLTVT